MGEGHTLADMVPTPFLKLFRTLTASCLSNKRFDSNHPILIRTPIPQPLQAPPPDGPPEGGSGCVQKWVICSICLVNCLRSNCGQAGSAPCLWVKTVELAGRQNVRKADMLILRKRDRI